MEKQKSKSNKGFSLVELIVVIAIMAVLVGLLAPQFVKYVGQSQSSRDKQNFETIRRAANIVLADPTLTTTSLDKTSIEVSTKLEKKDTDDAKSFKALFIDAIGADAISNLPSGSKWTVTVTAQADGGFTASVVDGNSKKDDNKDNNEDANPPA